MKSKISLQLSNFEPENYFRSIEELAKQMGYELIGKCSCSDKTSHKENKNLGKRVRCALELYVGMNEKVDCVHYGKKTEKNGSEGIVFVVESAKEEEIGFSINSRVFNGGNSLAVDSPEKMGVVRCYGYGENYAGKNIQTDFGCKEGAYWRQKLSLPASVKSLELREDFDLSSNIYDYFRVMGGIDAADLESNGLAKELSNAIDASGFLLNSVDLDRDKKQKQIDVINGFTRELSKSMNAFDLGLLASVNLDRHLKQKELYITDEIVYDTIGFPTWHNGSKKKRFLKGREIDVSDKGLEEIERLFSEQ